MGYIETYENFFEEVATKYKPIGHTPAQKRFASMSQDEIIQGRRSNMDLSEFCMILLKFEPKQKRNEARQYRMEFLAAFEIVKDLGRDPLSKTNVQDEALSMCEEVMAKISLPNGFTIGNIRDETIEYYAIEPLLDSVAGYGVEFVYTVGLNRSAKVKVENWI